MGCLLPVKVRQKTINKIPSSKQVRSHAFVVSAHFKLSVENAWKQGRTEGERGEHCPG